MDIIYICPHAVWFLSSLVERTGIRINKLFKGYMEEIYNRFHSVKCLQYLSNFAAFKAHFGDRLTPCPMIRNHSFQNSDVADFVHIGFRTEEINLPRAETMNESLNVIDLN